MCIRDRTEAAIQAISAGLDVEASSECFPHLIAMVKEKKIDEKLIDKAVSRVLLDRKSTRLNSSHSRASRMPSSA